MKRWMLTTFLVMLAFTAGPAPAQEISDEELLVHLKARYAALNNMEVVFRTRYYNPYAGVPSSFTPGSDFPSIPEGRPVEPPDELKDDLLSTAGHHRVAFSDGKIRAERLAEVDPRNNGRRSVQTWDGLQARAKSDDPYGGGLPLRILSEPDGSFFMQGFGTWLGMWLFSNRDMTPDAIFRSAPEKERRVEGEVTIWAFHPPMSGAGELEIRAVRDPDIRITSITRRSYHRDENQIQTSIVSREEWIEYDRNAPEDGLLLPRRARLTTKSYSPDGAPRMWSVETFELESIEPLGELPDDFFRISDENDVELPLTDEVGGRELNVNGNRADLVERGKTVNEESRAEASRPSSPPALLWWIAGSMMAVGFIGIVLWIVTRTRR